MRFADPRSCPDCRGVLDGQPACPRCGLDLTSMEARQLWQVLLQADDLLARAGQHRLAPVGQPPAPQPQAPAQPQAPEPRAPQPQAPPAADPFVAVPPTWQPYPARGSAPPAEGPPAAVPPRDAGRGWSVGTILLVLGAFGLVAAGIIFVTRSWEDLGLAARTLVLLGVTAVIGALGVWVTRRPLRASAEAVWSVFLALLTLDFFAARHENLAGIGSLSVAGGWLVWGIVALALSTAIAVWARPHVNTVLIATAVASSVAITIAGIGAGGLGDDWDFAWRAVIALIVTGVLALATRPAKLPPTTLAARAVVAVFFVAAYVAAFAAVIDHPSPDELAGSGHGAPMLLMGVAAVVIAWLVPVVRIPAVALAVLAACALVVVPVADAGTTESAWLVLAVLAVALSAVGTRGVDDWMRGVRLGAVPAVAGIAVVHIALVAELFATMGNSLGAPWEVAGDARLDPGAVADRAAWIVPVVLVALVATAWFVARWPELSAARHAPAAAVVALAIGGADAVAALKWPVWAAALSLLVLAAGLVVARRRTHAAVPTVLVAWLALVAASLASASQGVSAATWLLGGLLLVIVALLSTGDQLRHAHAVIGTGLVLGGTAALVDLLDVADGSVPLLVVAVALALMAAAQLAPAFRPVGLTVEIAAAVGLGIALLTPGTSGQVSVRWTIAGVALIALSFVAAGRRWLVWPGLAALVVAYLALIVDSGFSFVEAYTLPLGAAGLAAGTFAAVKKPEISTWAVLGPGLALALLPSVPQALAEPTGLRALLLGAAALAVLAVGVRLGWQAPFVAGVTILTLLVLFNIGPYANAAPRVVLIAVVSAVLLAVGITWEDRVRDGRRIVAYVRSMR
ncbi:SCO7613 C-terminal domain-containing membrane protein [Aeromicrobium wangtongii]|uniref:SCO7613 C-terminal domain-containing membrane protein n=1 Tax=Aeromicrobium wangtongii TaxID=2969247 RepID=UPI002017CC85|nr:hypothetical protein [Aeromicrobium wangtongii]MCL3818627.1 hypothetical protein [Aeromicrobium wangtongii]